MENSEAVLLATMSGVISEHPKFAVNWTDIWIERWTSGCFLHVVPITIGIGTRDCVVCHDIVRVCNPEATWRLVSVQEAEGSLDLNSKIMLKSIFCFSCILHEESVAHRVKGHVVSDTEVMDSVSCYGSVVGLVNGVTFNVRFYDRADQMEMDRVPTKLKRLANIKKLNVLDVAN